MVLAAEIIGVPWWVWLLIIIGLLVLLFFLRGKARPALSAATAAGPATVTPAAPMPERVAPVAAAAPVADSAPPAAPPDDLAVIEGIGPRIAEILQAAGISSFSQLAATSTERMSEILDAADLHFADPETWARQAALAAEARWDDLKTLQDELKGGRTG